MPLFVGFPPWISDFLWDQCLTICTYPSTLSPLVHPTSGVYQTAKSVRESYDALVEIFECVEGFLRRLMIYTKFERPPFAMAEVVIKIMAELISVLALATKQINQGLFSESVLGNCHPKTYSVAEKYGRKLLGDNEIKAVLQRLDRLTMEESREAVTQTFDVVYGLVKNIEVIMEGAHRLLVWLCTWYEAWTR